MHAAIRAAGALCLLTVLGGCSTMSRITATTPTTQLSMKNRDRVTMPARVNIRGTSFGNYEFKAEDTGQAPLYGILPLQMKGGHMALDILFFAPGMMFNLRGAFPFYEIDVAHGLIRYRSSVNAAWSEYRPSSAEIARARQFFDGSRTNTAVATSVQHTAPAQPAARSAASASTGIISPDDPTRHPSNLPLPGSVVSH